MTVEIPFLVGLAVTVIWTWLSATEKVIRESDRLGVGSSGPVLSHRWSRSTVGRPGRDDENRQYPSSGQLLIISGPPGGKIPG
jgi:hypothetical protein